MFDSIKKLFKVPEPVKEEPKVEVKEEVKTEPEVTPEEQKPKKPRKPRAKKKKQETNAPKTAKELATEAGEPYIAILSVDVDPENINNGAFELDWNDKFVLNLVRAGYKLKEDDKDSDIVDRWFQTVCRNIALEFYEQDQADPVNRSISEMMMIRSRDLGNGRTEVS
jgi:hypothetical protein